MPIPDFEADGLLPVGLHECTLDEVAERYGRFTRTSIRPDLTAQLRAYVAEARATSLVSWLAIDGSYVTGAAEPGDIDLVVVLNADYDFRAEVPPSAYNVVSRRRVKARYNFDVLTAPADSPLLHKHLAFFQTTRGGKPKGLLKVAL